MEDVLRVLSETFRVKQETLYPDISMEDIDSWDSLTHMEMIANLESEFDIEFTNDEIMNMSSVGSICKIVEDKWKHGA